MSRDCCIFNYFSLPLSTFIFNSGMHGIEFNMLTHVAHWKQILNTVWLLYLNKLLDYFHNIVRYNSFSSFSLLLCFKRMFIFSWISTVNLWVDTHVPYSASNGNEYSPAENFTWYWYLSLHISYFDIESAFLDAYWIFDWNCFLWTSSSLCLNMYKIFEQCKYF